MTVLWQLKICQLFEIFFDLLLYRMVIAIVIVSWAAYLTVPERALGWGGLMMKSPLMLTWLAMALIVLPILIRMWMEPDEVGEPRVVTMERGLRC
jgi:hypothetical protein